MSYKNIAILILIVVVLSGSGLSFYYYRDSVKKSGGTGLQNDQQESLKVEEKQITDETSPFKIDIKYPYIEGMEEFNQKIAKVIDEQIKDFKEFSLENDQAVKETDPESYAKYPRQYDLAAGYYKGQTNENVASVVLSIYSYVGGAHGNTSFIAVNYDVKNKKEIKLADLFFSQPDYLQKISAYCVTDLKKQLEAADGMFDEKWVEDGAGPKEENFSVFLIKSGSITFYFPQYQVAPYASGYFEVVMPK